MTCGCSGNKNQQPNQFNQQTKQLSLEDIKDKPIDEIIGLYQQGYALEQQPNYKQPNYNIDNLQAWPVDAVCTQAIVNVGSTITSFLGYVFKLKDVQTCIDAPPTCVRTALFGVLLNGTEVDVRTIELGQSIVEVNPSDTTQKFGIVAKQFQFGKETQVVVTDLCRWTQQDAVITMINVPSSYVDNVTYTVIGTGKKSISNSPLETMVLTENGNKITEVVPDSTGLFSLTFKYHEGKTYSVEYPGTIGVTYGTLVLKQGTETFATHQIRYIYPVKIPDAIFTVWQSIPDPIAMLGTWILEHIPLPGYQILDIRMYSDQIQIDLKQTSPSPPLSYSSSNNYSNNYLGTDYIDINNYLGTDYIDIDNKQSSYIDNYVDNYMYNYYSSNPPNLYNLQADGSLLLVNYARVAQAGVAGISGARMIKAGLVVGAVAAIGIVAFIFLSRIDIMKWVGGVLSKIFGKEAPDNKGVIPNIADPDNPESLYSDMIKNCLKDFDACDKSTPEKAKVCCVGDATVKGYLRCLDQAGVATIQGGLGAGFPKSLTELTAIADDLTKKVGNECIAKFNTGELTCAQAVTCIQNLYRAAASPTGGSGGGPGAVYGAIYKNYDPNAEWDGGKYGSPAGGEAGALGKILLYGGAIVIGGYFAYKYITKPKPAEIRVRTE